MNNPHSSGELAQEIEALVRRHVEAVRQEAQAAILRAFGSQAVVAASRPASQRRHRTAGDRRSAKQVAELGQRLYEAMRKQPGESMAVLATEVGASVRELHLPMTVLKREGKIRSVGERQHTRYYPAASA